MEDRKLKMERAKKGMRDGAEWRGEILKSICVNSED